MFKCVKCPIKYNKKRKPTKGNTSNGDKEFRVATIIRKVRYLNQIRFDKVVPDGESSKTITSYKNLTETTGTEIVEQESYCKNHVPKNLKVKVLDKVLERVNIVSVKRPHRGEN